MSGSVATHVPCLGWWVYYPTERLPVGQPRGVPRPHRLAWGDDTLSYIVCVRCGVGFSRNVKVLDTLGICSGVGDRSVREWRSP